MLGVEYACAFLEYPSADLAVRCEHLLRAPARVDYHSVLAGLSSLGRGGRHNVFCFKRKHGDFAGSATKGDAGCVNGHIASADHYDLAAELALSAVGLMQEVNGSGHALCVLTRNARQARALAANCHVEGLVALCTQLVEGDVLAHFHACAYLHADFAHYVDFRVDDLLVELVGRDTIAKHSARLRILLEHGRVVAHGREVVGAAKS